MPPARLSTEDILRLLTLVVERVAARGERARIFVVGGVALALKYYPEGVERRPTEDIDAVFSPAAPVIEEVQAVAAEHGLATDWFNNRAGGYLPPHEDPAGEVLLRRGDVEVLVASPQLLLAMKARACRLGRDDEDIAVLIRHLGIRSIEEIDELVDRTWLGEHPIPPSRRKVVEATFGEYVLTRSDPPQVLPQVRHDASATRG